MLHMHILTATAVVSISMRSTAFSHVLLSLTSDLSVEVPMDSSDMRDGCPSGARLRVLP